MSYYYKHPDQGRVLNSAIIAISEDSFDARLPNIKAQTWSAILNRRHGHSNAQCERLEFIGDAVMYLCVALELYDRYPHASPGLMTNVRAPFVTNLVLSLLAEKIDRRAARKGSILQPVLNVRKQVVAHNQEAVIIKTTVPHDTVKVAADTMEMAIGALYMERGLDAVRQWVSRTYDPLFRVAIETHNQTSQAPPAASSSKKRGRDQEEDDSFIPPTKRQRPPSPAKQRPPLHERITNTFVPPRKRNDQVNPWSNPLRPVIIDLTLEDSDTDVDVAEVTRDGVAQDGVVPAVAKDTCVVQDGDGSLDMDISLIEGSDGSDMDISYTEVSSGSGGPIWIDLTHDDDDEPARPVCAPPTPLASRPSVLQFMRKFVKRTDAADGGGDADDESDGGSGPSKRYELKSSFLSEISHRRTRSPPRLAQKGTALGSFGRQERVGSALTKRDKPPHLPSRFVSAGTVLPVNPPTPSRRCLPDDSSSCDELTDVEAALDRFSDEDDAGYRR